MSFWGRNWWVICFCLLTATLHFHFLKGKKGALLHMAARLHQMEKEKAIALQRREELSLTIGSQEDPAWVEMILMRDLGVVPEGFLKVHFKK
jgi:hypothetical protein